MQNAVKYNLKNGKITIETSLLRRDENDQNFDFITRIIDTGNGIEPERA